MSTSHSSPTSTSSSPRYAAFTLTDHVYKTVSNNHALSLTIFAPKSLSSTTTSGARPIIVRWHGGFLITGTRTYDEWWPTWILELADRQGAILISPDYRLLPESSGADTLSDIHSFASWLCTSLNATLGSLSAPLSGDLSRILVTGDSAGGWCALHTAFPPPSVRAEMAEAGVRIRALAIAYGMLDLRTAWWSEPGSKHPFGAPTVPQALLLDHVRGVKQGELPGVVSGARPPERLPFCMAAVQGGLFPQLLGTEDRLYPMEVLDRVKAEEAAGGEEVPKMWLYHGKEDSAVPVDETVAFGAKVARLFGEEKVKVTLVDGAEHGFDNPGAGPVGWKVGDEGMDGEWGREGLEWVGEAWLM